MPQTQLGVKEVFVITNSPLSTLLLPLSICFFDCMGPSSCNFGLGMFYRVFKPFLTFIIHICVPFDPPTLCLFCCQKSTHILLVFWLVGYIFRWVEKESFTLSPLCWGNHTLFHIEYSIGQMLNICQMNCKDHIAKA